MRMRMGMEVEMEMEMEEKKPWKVVNRRRRRMKENQQQLSRPWDALPSLALSNIFVKLDLKDRCGSVPFVCKEWNSVISGDPLCWSSMISESASPEEAFIKNPADYYSLQVYPRWSYDDLYYYRDDGEDYYYPLVIRGGKWDGVSRFRRLLRKSSSSSSSSSSSASTSTSTTSTITSLYLTPFTFSHLYNEQSLDQDEILHLIASCCPNLKHISFDGFHHFSKGAMLEVFHRCNKLELIDFSDSLGVPEADSLIEVIQQLGNNLPFLRGIRILNGWREHPSIVNAIATHLPRIKLLDIECDAIEVPRLLLSSEIQLLELQYLRVGVYYFTTVRLPPPPPVRTTHIPEFHYEDIDFLFENYPNYCLCGPRNRRAASLHSRLCSFCRENERKEKKEKQEEDILSEFSSHPDPQDHSILKQKREDEYYLSIFKENKKKKKKKKKTRNHPRRRGLMKKKNTKASSLKIDHEKEDYLLLCT